jgi:N-acetylmuramoyl-L-alanine amidase
VGLVVVVDPGHNGANGAHPAEIGRLVDAGGFQKPCNTTGTAGDGYPESRFNWETSQRLAAALEARGATVVLTRTSDDGWGPCVDERGLTAQRERAALIVSIHADGADPGASGFHVIHPATGPAVTGDVAERSALLATAVRDRLTEAGVAPADYLGGGTGLVARTDIATLNRAGVPGVMVECGNMRNSTDLARLRSPEGQQAVADAIVLAVVDRFAAR